ncbi:MAG: AGE family epimerase/isomerase [Victivallales bacterium]|nr:AGE family epimerase/isomerase [Victivallales bacterium]
MFKSYVERYEKELLENVIPFWENHCPDRDFGGYFTSLDRDGSVYDTTKYMWMQWRIVYMFGELYMTGYGRPEWLEIARNGFDFLYAKGRDANGSYYFALNREGDPVTAPYNIYSDCFAAMGAAVLYRAAGDAKYRQAAEAAMNRYLARMDNPKGRWEKNLPGKPHYLALGHYMMLANLGLLMDSCLETAAYSEVLANAVATVMSKFRNPQSGLMFENIRPDGSFDLNSCEGRMLNPGHVLEAMWFILNYYEREQAAPERIAQVAEIIKTTLDFGWDREHGGIFYFMDALGKPHLELQWDMKLWWVHNEALVACLYAGKMTGDPVFFDWFKRLDAWTWQHFPDPEYGEWFGYLNRQGQATHMLKGGKWKTFFHLPRCLLVSLRLMKEIKG